MACSAQITHTMHPLWSRSALTVWRAVTPCCHAMLACSMRAQHASDTTAPALRACANYHTHLPEIKRRGSSSSDIRLAMQTTKPLFRGAHRTQLRST